MVSDNQCVMNIQVYMLMCGDQLFSAEEWPLQGLPFLFSGNQLLSLSIWVISHSSQVLGEEVYRIVSHKYPSSTPPMDM